MEKGMIFQYVIIGVVFVCIVVYVVLKVKNGGKTGGCSCCDIKDCKLKQTKKKKDCCKCCVDSKTKCEKIIVKIL